MSVETKERECISWDTCEIYKNKTEFLMSEDPDLDEDQAFQMACEDWGLVNIEWDYFTDVLGETLKARSNGEGWYVTVSGFGWRKISGHLFIDTDNPVEFLRGILPDTDCTFKIYTDKEGYLELQNWHHDAPTGSEWYKIVPALDWYLLEEAEILRDKIQERLEQMLEENKMSDTHPESEIERWRKAFLRADGRYGRREFKNGGAR